ncbi:MAG: glycosyltransferase family 4 protein [Alphaproteobacteria bacterium]|nr:glycosyltransferase family 4 protein [Alphaproteobacteria bacterium]
MPQPSSLALTWALSTISGYGMYGVQIALQFLRRGGGQIISTHQPGPVMLPEPNQSRMAPVLELAAKIAGFMRQNPDEMLGFEHAVLHAAGNDFAGFEGQDRVRGRPNVGCAAIEHKVFSPNAREVAGHYDMLIAISRWNEQFLRELNVGPVHLCHQGIDCSLFFPAPSSGRWRDRFVVFSGGKFEFRKGQDIVATAFKIFRERHPEALLVASWQNLLPLDPAPFQLAGHCRTVPQGDGQTLHTARWLLEQGLPEGSFIDLPYTHNMLMPQVLRECDVALFPNRCEGGTNLVAMEAMACGVPVFVANNTGQRDLVEMLGCGALYDQKPVKAAPGMAALEDWGETSVDETVAALEKAYTQRAAMREQAWLAAEKIKAWDWPPQNEKLLRLVCA